MRLTSVICLVAICIFGILPSDARADIVLDGDSIHVDLIFHVNDSTSTRWWDFDFPDWNPSNDSEACDKPYGDIYRMKGTSHCHFKILNSSGTCMLFNSRLTRALGDTGDFRIDMSFPTEESLGENSFVFHDSSDYTGIVVNDYRWDGQSWPLSLDEGETYRFQVVETIDCVGTSDGAETVTNSETIYIECCDGIRGNVDNDPNETVALSDLTLLISYLTNGTELPCPVEADVDGDDDIDWDDFDYLNAFIYLNGPAPVSCP